MKQLKPSRFCSLFLSFMLMVSHLPLVAMAENFSEYARQEQDYAQEEGPYIYLNNKLYNIAEFIFTISALDNDLESPVHTLKQHILNGFEVGLQDEVLQVLGYADWLLDQEDLAVDQTRRNQLFLFLENIVQAIIDGTLAVDFNVINKDKKLPLKVINKRLKVKGKAKFESEAIFYEKTRFHRQARFYKRAHFKEGIHVNGTATIQDIVTDNLTVNNCISDLCVTNLSVVDATIDHLTLSGGIVITDLTLNSLTATDAVIDNLQVNNCIPHLCVEDLSVENGSVSGTLSINEAVIQNLDLAGGLTLSDVTLNTATITDAVIDNLQVNNCISHLCVEDLSVANGSVNGTLSINDAVIQTLDLTGGLTLSDVTLGTASIADAVVDNLQVNNCVSNLCIDNLTVNSCIPELCVTHATLTDLAVTGSLSVTDAFIEHLDIAQNTLHFNDASGVNYVGMTAPVSVPTSYTVNLPTNAPIAQQVLRANAITPTNLEWAVSGGSISPTVSDIIYVTKYGSDITGNGSFDAPFATLTKAVDVANGISTLFTPVVILVGPGLYVEDNSIAPIAVTSDGISILGESSTAVFIIPNTPSNDLLSVNKTITISNISFTAPAPGISTAAGINFTSGQLSHINNVRIFDFQSGVICSGGATDAYIFDSCFFVQNGTALIVNDTVAECNICSFLGVESLAGSPANTAMSVSGLNATVVVNSGSCVLCENGFEVANNATLSVSATVFKLNIFDLMASTAAHATLTGCSFELTNSSSDIDLQISGAGTSAYLIGCEFSGNSALGVPEATGILVSNNAFVEIDGGTMNNYTTGIKVGLSSDAASTIFSASAFSIRNCTTDIQQQGSSTLNFNAGTASGSKIIVNDPTNVTLSFFDLEDNNALAIGSTADKNTDLIDIAITATNNPSISYVSSLYSAQSVGYVNTLGNPSTLFTQADNDTKLAAITTLRTHTAGVRLMSDTASPVGGTSALRGWDVYKNGSTAELIFQYQNNDPLLLGTTLPYTVMQLDGVSNQVQLPTTNTEIVFATDTNLYRSSAGVLKTDNNMIVGTLTPGRVVVADAITNQLSSSITTATEVSYLSGVTSPIQPQLNNKVSRSGDTMTGTLQLPAGSTSSPSLVFTGSTTTGLSASAGNLSLSTNGAEAMKISSGGIVSIDGFTSAGVVHNDASGNLSSSLIVNADISPAAGILDTKLATISTAGKVANSATTATSVNNINTIVERDASGNFSAGTITANLIGNATTATTAATSTNFSGTLAGDVTGTQSATVVSSVGGKTASDIANAVTEVDNATNLNIANRLVLRDGTGSFATQTISLVDEVATGSITVTPFSAAGIVHNDTSGLFSSSLIVNADVSASAGIVDTKLATIATPGKVANSATTATSSNTANAIVARDASGNFTASTITANLTGTASNNVLKAGDTMTGTLTMATQNKINFQDVSGTHFVGLNAPSLVPTSYTLSLPSTVPAINQTLRAGSVTPTDLQWVTEGGSIPPAVSETIYVTKYGNDITGDGSFDEPFVSLSKAISVANGISSVSTPVTIIMGPGIYVEDNSAGPLSVTVEGVSITGDSPTSVIIMPGDLSNDLLSSNQSIVISLVSFVAGGTSSGTALVLSNGLLTECLNVRFTGFQIGVTCSGGAFNSYAFGQCYFIGNGTGIDVNGTVVQVDSCTVIGSASLVSPANTGINVTGTGAVLILDGGVCGICETGMNINNSAIATIAAVEYESNIFDIVQTTAAQVTLSGSNFQYTVSPGDIKFQCSDAGSLAQITACRFNGLSSLGAAQGIAIAVANGAVINMNGCEITNYDTAIQVGATTDSSTTVLSASSTAIRISGTNDILQQGTSSLDFTSGVANSSKISINDSSNVHMAYFDMGDNDALTIGSGSNQSIPLIQPYIDPVNHPSVEYLPSLYSTQAIGFENLFGNPSTLFVEANADAKLAAVTTIRTDLAGIRLVSDTASPVGGTTALRGWDINKNATTAELSFNYQNSDVSGQSVIPEYTVIQLDGVNNQLQLPTANTEIVFAGDTNLYRSSANVLKTDDNLIVGTLTPGRVVVTDGVTNELSSSVTTTTELSYVSGVTSPIQTQLNNKVSRSGDTMTGTLQLPAGTTSAPSLTFTGSTTTGLSANSNNLSLSANGAEVMKLSSTGVVSIDAFSTAGVVHNDASGNLSSSLIVNADITDATISNAKLATASSSDVSNYIVVRDVSGNFATNKITIDGAVTNPTDAATKAYVDNAVATGFEVKNPALVASTTNITLTGLQTIDGVALSANDRVLLVGQTNPVQNGLWLAQAGAWTRPADFASGTVAGAAYVLVTSGNTYAGASWVCTTPTAVIDTDPLMFSQFSLASDTTGANIGAGSGLVFANKTGVTLNFRSLLAGAHTTFTTNTSDITLTTDATSANTPSTLIARDASGNFNAGTITASLTGSASNNVLKAGDTMTGALTVPAGTAANPSLNFTGSTTTGLSAQVANTLVLSTAGVEAMKISPTGIVSIDTLTPTAGVVHNDSAGNLSSSLIVNADVSASAAISDTKLATITTAGKVSNSATTATSNNTANAIVARDASGNFTANIITATLNGSATNNVLKAGDTMTGTLQLPAGTTVLPSLVFTGSTTTGLSASAGNLSFSTNGAESMKISSGGVVSIDGFTSTGVVHNDASGNLSSSLIVNADISASAAITDNKLATISTAGKVANSATTATSANTANAIVARDASGNFSAGTITANLIGNATTATTATTTTNFTGSLSGDVTGTQNATVVSLVGGQTAAAVASATTTVDNATNLNIANRLVLRDGTGSFTAQTISLTDEVATGSITVTPFSTPGIIHNNAAGLFSSSLIVNADVSASAAIADTKLATISTPGKVVNSATSATSANTANAIVARDASGNFTAGTITANLTGSASNNVLKAGDTMTGTLTMATQNQMDFQDASGTHFVGLNAPTSVPTSYTLSLPSTVPTANQTLRAGSVTPTNLQWVTEGGSIAPATSETIYVTKYGNDTTGNGSFDSPYATLSKAISVANTLSTALNPIAILISAGVYVEDNSAGPLTVTAQGVSIISPANETAVIIPAVLSNNLLLCTQSVNLQNLTFDSNGVSTATCLIMTVGNFTNINNVQFFGFQMGVECTGGPLQSYGFNACLFANNGTGLYINNTAVECTSSIFLGAGALTDTPANTGILIDGGNALSLMTGGLVAACLTGIQLQNNASLTINANSFAFNVFDIVQTGGSQSNLSGCVFEFTATSSDIDIQVSGTGTTAQITGCSFSGKSALGVAQGTAIEISGGANVTINSGNIQSYTTGVIVGTSTDTSSTSLTASSLAINNCTTQILQQGSATLEFVSGIATAPKISINDSTNVSMSFFDLNDNNALTIGSSSNKATILLQPYINTSNQPSFIYAPSLYSTQAVGFENLFGNPSSLFVEANANVDLTAVTTLRTDTAGIRLVSDTAFPVGGTTALRGWDINKNATTAELAFKYQNSDTVGQSAISQYTLMQLDGVNKQLQLPTANTQILFGGDTNLYRSSAGVLKTDNNLIVGTLIPGRAVVTDAVTNQLSSSATTATEIGYVSGVTSSIQTQLNNKVSRSGDTMTGTLQLPAGSTSSPSLIFTGSTTTGLSASAGNLSLSTNGAEAMKISSGGIVSIDGFTSAGVVHNDASGNLSSSLIVNADISASAAITDSKLATISTAGKVANSATTATNANVANAIVARDASGNFVTNEITITGTVTNPTDVATKAYVDSAVISTGTNLNMPNTLVKRDGTGSFAAQTISLVDEVATGSITVIPFNTAGVVHNSASGLLSSSLIVNGDITNATISNAKLATISNLNVAGDIVVRDGSGNFSAGTITANLTGNATTATSFTGALAGDVTGTQSATVVSLVGGVTAANVASGANAANAATNLNTASTIVKRDASGNFSAGTITANLTGNATTATTATNFSGSLAGDVTGTQSATVVSTVGGVTAANVASGANAANAATNLNTASTIVKRDASGNFSAGTITANLTGNATTATTATNFSGSLSGDVTGTQSATVVSLVGGVTAAAVASATTTVNAATSNNTPNTLVKRDGTGSFSTQNITAAGFLSIPTTASLAVGTIQQNGVSLIHSFGTNNTFVGQGAGNFTTSGAGANTGIGTNALTSNTTGTANIAVGTNALTSNTTGTANTAVGGGALSSNITGTNNTAIGASALSGNTVGNNTAVGAFALRSNTTGTANTAIGSGALATNSTGINNTAVGNNALIGCTVGTNNTTLGNSAGSSITTGSNNTIIGSGVGTILSTGSNNIYIDGNNLNPANESNAIRIGNTQTACYIQGINGVSVASPVSVVIGSNGQLGTSSASTVTFAAGSAANPSIQFSGSTNTGFSAPTANTLSFDTNGTERMSISTTNIIDSLPLCNQAIQVVSITGNNQSVTANSTTSILLLQPTANRNNFTITFPASPTNGQYFSVTLGATFTVSVNNAGNGATVVNGITSFSSSSGQAGVTYIYYAPSNSWYRFSTS